MGQQVHGSCVALPADSGPALGVLIVGPSGAGKSGLALELMAYGARLVADDRTDLAVTPAGLVASAPPGLPPLIEARGIGLIPAKRLASCVVRLVVDLGQQEDDRLPPPRRRAYLGQELWLLHAVASRSFPAAILQYLRHLATESPPR